MSRSARLLDLLQALRRRRRPVTAATLAGELGVSVRTVYRDAATLVGQGAPIEGAAGLRWVAKRGDGPLTAAAADALAKISAVLPAAARELADHAGLLAGPGGPPPPRPAVGMAGTAGHNGADLTPAPDTI